MLIDLFGLRKLALRPILLGTLAGTWSHIARGSFVCADAQPCAPKSDANGLFQTISLSSLHCWCAGAGLCALLVHVVRTARKRPGPD